MATITHTTQEAPGFEATFPGRAEPKIMVLDNTIMFAFRPTELRWSTHAPFVLNTFRLTHSEIPAITVEGQQQDFAARLLTGETVTIPLKYGTNLTLVIVNPGAGQNTVMIIQIVPAV